jgi:hypothetical protein
VLGNEVGIAEVEGSDGKTGSVGGICNVGVNFLISTIFDFLLEIMTM